MNNIKKSNIDYAIIEEEITAYNWTQDIKSDIAMRRLVVNEVMAQFPDLAQQANMMQTVKEMLAMGDSPEVIYYCFTGIIL